MNMKQKTNNSYPTSAKDNKEFAVALLAKKAGQAYEARPDENSLGLIANVLTKMVKKGKLSISKKDFESVFRSFASSESLAADVFASELSLEQRPESTRKIAGYKLEEAQGPSVKGFYDQTMHDAIQSMWDANGQFVKSNCQTKTASVKGPSADGLYDSKLKNAIEGFFDNTTGRLSKEAAYKEYDKSTESKAKNITHLELSRIGLEPNEISVIAGYKDFILCKASYMSLKGSCSILVPVQITKNSSAAIPTFFATQYGFVELQPQSIRNYLEKTAGKNYTIDVNQVFESITLNKQADLIDEFSLTVLAAQEAVITKETKLNTNKAPISYRSPEADSFEKKLSTVSGVAEFKFGKLAVDEGRKSIAAKLDYFGYRPQVKVSSTGEDCIMYAVAIDTKVGKLGFEVMAEIQDESVSIPSIIAVDDKVYEFSYAGLEKLVNHKASSLQALAKVSTMYDLQSSEILNTVKQASDKNNYKELEEALTVLAEKGDDQGYILAMAEYMKCVNKTSCVEEKCSCSKVIKIASDSKPYCGHLNLPLDQVVQENGVCTPKYRMKMAATEKYNNIFLNTSKLLFS